ncbi:MAG: DUF3348 domain-containing protein [Azoarcus sp.]|nr:DUF3348 domain-containing protein [Azoarcus sp.]
MPRTGFNRSRLVRALADLAATDAAESKQSFADRLGQWLDFNSALSLYSVLNAGTEGVAKGASVALTAAAAREEFARVRGGLVESITPDGVLRPGKTRMALPDSPPQASIEGAADLAPDFAPYHRYYLAHQRDMNTSIGPLRATVRAALAAHSPALERLAALDAVMDQALEARERKLLATVPGRLAKRFEQLFGAHRAARADTQVDSQGDIQVVDDPDRWMQPGGWLAVFCAEMQVALLAELEVRLQPIAGLIEALDNEVTS